MKNNTTTGKNIIIDGIEFPHDFVWKSEWSELNMHSCSAYVDCINGISYHVQQWYESGNYNILTRPTI